MVRGFVALGAGSANSSSFTPVEQPELYPRTIGCPSHDTAQRVYLANNLAFCKPADSRVTRHLRDSIQIDGEHKHPPSEPSGCYRRFNARMTGTDHYYVVLTKGDAHRKQILFMLRESFLTK
jgi:hypothetical protein